MLELKRSRALVRPLTTAPPLQRFFLQITWEFRELVSQFDRKRPAPALAVALSLSLYHFIQVINPAASCWKTGCCSTLISLPQSEGFKRRCTSYDFATLSNNQTRFTYTIRRHQFLSPYCLTVRIAKSIFIYPDIKIRTLGEQMTTKRQITVCKCTER